MHGDRFDKLPPLPLCPSIAPRTRHRIIIILPQLHIHQSISFIIGGNGHYWLRSSLGLSSQRFKPRAIGSTRWDTLSYPHGYGLKAGSKYRTCNPVAISTLGCARSSCFRFTLANSWHRAKSGPTYKDSNGLERGAIGKDIVSVGLLISCREPAVGVSYHHPKLSLFQRLVLVPPIPSRRMEHRPS